MQKRKVNKQDELQKQRPTDSGAKSENKQRITQQKKGKKMTNLQENGATTEKVEESNSRTKKAKGETNMSSVKENKVTNTQNAVEKEENKGTSIMTSQDIAKFEYKNEDANLFYPPGSGITEDIAIKKLVMLANSIAKRMNHFKQSCKIIIAYKDLSSVIFSDTYREILFKNNITNSFYESETTELDDIIECFGDFDISKEPGLHYYINLPKKDIYHQMLVADIKEVQKTDIIEFRDSFKRGINLFDIMTQFEVIKHAFTNYKLIDMTFTLDAQYSKNSTLMSTSTIVLKIDFLDNCSKKIQEFKVTFNLRSAECINPTVIAATSYNYSLEDIIMDPCFCL